MLILIFWGRRCSHILLGWVLGRTMHIHTPYSTTITAFYVEINYEIGENSFDSVGFMDICSKIKGTLSLFYSFPCHFLCTFIAHWTLKTQLWLQCERPELSCALIIKKILLAITVGHNCYAVQLKQIFCVFIMLLNNMIPYNALRRATTSMLDNQHINSYK